MKINGEDLSRPVGVFTLRREHEDGYLEHEIPIQALEPRFSLWVQHKLGPYPTPPVIPGSYEIVKGEKVQRVDRESPEFLKALDLYESRTQAAMIYYGTIQSDDGIVFETPGEGGSRDFSSFCDAFIEELKETLGEGEAPQWRLAIQTLGQTGTDEVQKATRAMFLGRAGVSVFSEEQEDERTQSDEP